MEQDKEEEKKEEVNNNDEGKHSVDDMSNSNVRTEKSSQQSSKPKHHITLIGDSILDNKHYVRSLPDVATQLYRKVVDRGWRVSLRAIDGDVCAGIPKQCNKSFSL